MRTYVLLFLVMIMLTVLPADAQRRKKVKQPEPTPEELAHKAKMEQMVCNTARVVFIDSIVVSKGDFLSHYNLNPEVGRVERYQDYYKTKRQPNAYVSVNEKGNRCYLSQENNEGTINLYFTEIVGGKWTRPSKLRGVNDGHEFTRVNYPFMMGDGETLYFAAEGGDGLGGYDIYTSSYDKSTGSFLQPANMGMPFNSEANDYMMVIDEYSNIGWFASDRNQPQDTVCIYVFIPFESRRTYDVEQYTPEEIASLARIQSITDTWGDRTELTQALARLQMTADRKHQKVKGRDFTFVINDEVTYYQLNDFKVPDNKKRYHELSSCRAQSQRIEKQLEKTRSIYSKSKGDRRRKLSAEILANEQEYEQLTIQIHQIEKEIRNAENLYLNKVK